MFSQQNLRAHIRSPRVTASGWYDGDPESAGYTIQEPSVDGDGESLVLDGQDGLYVASHSSRMGSCYPLGPPHMYNKLGLQREARRRRLAQQRSPNSRRSIVMSASSASPTLCAWVLSTCNRAHLAQWESSKLKLYPPNHRRGR